MNVSDEHVAYFSRIEEISSRDTCAQDSKNKFLALE
jgi:hypothetical protein